MQTQTSTSVRTVSPLSPQDAAWENFRRHVITLTKLDVTPENVRQYYALVGSYRALRRLYVQPRKVVRTKPGVRNPGLERWVKQTAHFNNSFWGKDLGHWEGEGDSKRWVPDRSARAGVAPKVLKVMLAWSKLRDLWHPHTPAGKEARRLSAMRHYAKPEGKAQKAAYQASAAGKASIARARKERTRKRAVAAGAAQLSGDVDDAGDPWRDDEDDDEPREPVEFEPLPPDAGIPTTMPRGHRRPPDPPPTAEQLRIRAYLDQLQNRAGQ